MTEKGKVLLLNKEMIAECFQTSPSIARQILLEHGVKPVDLGRGRSRGFRWYAPAVDEVMRRMHEDAQNPKPSPYKKASTRRGSAGQHLVLGKSAKELYADLYGKGEGQEAGPAE